VSRVSAEAWPSYGRLVAHDGRAMAHDGGRVAVNGFHLLAEPTGAICNLDCTYCFFLSK